MENLAIGDLVVLTAGSMRMAVEAVEDDRIACVWCHEGRIGRDAFAPALLKKWEHREDDRPARAEGAKPYRGDREGGGKPYGGPREAGAKPYGGPREAGAKPYGGPRDGAKSYGPPQGDKPRGKPGWDGKPREKKFFRKDG